MFPLFETIAIENGKPKNIEYHQARYERSLRAMYGKRVEQIHQLEWLIYPPPEMREGLVRCRIEYNNENCRVRYFRYHKRKIKTFKPVVCNTIDYALKYAGRTMLDELMKSKDDCDEIIIIKNGKVTDCSIGNLIFRLGDTWYTPDTPLLRGTQREFLLDQGKIVEREILAEEIDDFEEIRLINALNGLD